jgi:hypothetical protein
LGDIFAFVAKEGFVEGFKGADIFVSSAFVGGLFYAINVADCVNIA